MCRSGNLLHEFAPAGDLLDVAEAIVRVFHRLGDHEHKHMNRMKFLIKALGWERYRDAYEKERERIRVEGGAKLSFSPNDPPVEHAPTGARGPAPSPADVATRAASSIVQGPGITPAVKPELATTAADFARWEKTNVRPQKQEGCSTATAFFGRIELPRVKQLLADLETMTSESAEPQDYVDLAETSEFRPQTMAGECAS